MFHSDMAGGHMLVDREESDMTVESFQTDGVGLQEPMQSMVSGSSKNSSRLNRSDKSEEYQDNENNIKSSTSNGNSSSNSNDENDQTSNSNCANNISNRHANVSSKSDASSSMRNQIARAKQRNSAKKQEQQQQQTTNSRSLSEPKDSQGTAARTLKRKRSASAHNNSDGYDLAFYEDPESMLPEIRYFLLVNND